MERRNGRRGRKKVRGRERTRKGMGEGKERRWEVEKEWGKVHGEGGRLRGRWKVEGKGRLGIEGRL